MTDHPIHHSPLHGLRSSERLARRDVLGLSLERLSALAGDASSYRAFIRVTSGKKRAVTEPLGDLLAVHDRLYDLLDRIEKPDYLHSGVRGRSHVTNASAHLGDKATVKLDIRQFYPSIDVPRVSRFFGRQMACSAPVTDLLTRLCTFRGHVPIGSRMSQHLAYFAARPMLEDLRRLSERQGVVFTCYVDDLSFSGTAATPSFLWQVKRLVHHHRFGYHNGCCYRAGESRIITGVVVTGEKLAVLREQAERIRQDVRDMDKLTVDDQRRALQRMIGRTAAAASIDLEYRKVMKQLVARRARLKSAPPSPCMVRPFDEV